MLHSSLCASGTQAVVSSHLRSVPGLLHGPLPPHPPIVLPHPHPLAPGGSWNLLVECLVAETGLLRLRVVILRLINVLPI